MSEQTGGSSAKRFSCVKCGTPFDAYPPDSLHNIASRDRRSYDDHVKIDYKCGSCKTTNTIYWGHPKPFVATM